MHWARKAVFYFSNFFFFYILDFVGPNKRMHMKMTGTFAGSFTTIPKEVNIPKWVFVGLFCLVLFCFPHATFFLHSALLPSGPQTSDQGFTLWSSSHVDHRRSTGEQFEQRLSHSAFFFSHSRQTLLRTAFCSSLELVVGELCNLEMERSPLTSFHVDFWCAVCFL